MCRRTVIRERIMANVAIIEETGCWEWQGATSGEGRGGGYGRMSLDGHTVATHIAMFVNENGLVPGKKQIDHRCNNRICCNPQHLQMVTHKKNQKLRAARASKA